MSVSLLMNPKATVCKTFVFKWGSTDLPGSMADLPEMSIGNGRTGGCPSILMTAPF
jgi:hypothetical protein